MEVCVSKDMRSALVRLFVFIYAANTIKATCAYLSLAVEQVGNLQGPVY